jgi:hypothetical protein
MLNREDSELSSAFPFNRVHNTREAALGLHTKKNEDKPTV